MKMVTAIIQPLRLDEVVQALEVIGVDRLTITQVIGVGRTGPRKRIHPDEPPPAPLPPRTMIQVAVRAALLPEVIAAIRKGAVSGKPGDGKIFISEIERVIRVRDGEPER